MALLFRFRLRLTALLFFLLVFVAGEAFAFAPLFSTTASASAAATDTDATPSSNPFAEPQEEATLPQVKDVVTRVAVAGATGRTGRYVVEELLSRGVSEVVAVVRDVDKASEIFPKPPTNLEIVQCNLGNEMEIGTVLEGADAAIWCATGFSDAPGIALLEKVKRLLGFALAPKQSIDVVGLPAVAKALADQKSSQGELPKVVMCSSAGVTRPTWDEAKKVKFRGAAEIPIVRLNPFGILDRKRESEEELRKSGINYTIVRPGGLNDEWPPNSRPVFSQGDVAVGRIHRKDVASVLVDCLAAPEATGKTFEAIALAGYPKQRTLGPALSRLHKDTEGRSMSNDELFATYAAMQQLLPGERQDAAALAMGQTYEQLDEGKTGRLGKKGEENAEAAAPKPSD